MLWSGGKDSNLALIEARAAGIEVAALATFVPPQPGFKAHPLPALRLQAKALQLPFFELEVSPPFTVAYEDRLRYLCSALEATVLVTGDIDLIDGQPNWIRERANALGLTCEMPLWRLEREDILQRLLSSGLDIMFSCVRVPPFSLQWPGRRLDEAAVAELISLRDERGIDICGENGEYHTLVLSGPGYSHKLEIATNKVVFEDGLAFLVPEGFALG